MNPHRISMTRRAALLLCLPGLAGAHVGERVYPIPYLSDEMLEEIRLDDGLVEEWPEWIGEPTLIPTPPAIFGAIHHATGARLTRAPATPDRVRAAILARDGGRNDP